MLVCCLFEGVKTFLDPKRYGMTFIPYRELLCTYLQPKAALSPATFFRVSDESVMLLWFGEE